MFIANPIYDSVFKYLMEDLEVAKRLISVIIEEQILDIEVLPQEFTTFYQRIGVSILRLDFKAIIKTKEGDAKKVLIELQKSKNALDIRRFRRYLGDNYSRIDVVGKKKESLPIITIYFLGFDLTIHAPVIKVNRTYTNQITKAEIKGKDDFIEKLTHDSYVIQIPQLPEITQTKLEKILSIFNQKWVYDHDNRWLMAYDDSKIDDEDLAYITKRLEHAAQDPDTRDNAEIENELEEGLDQKFFEKEQKITDLEDRLEQVALAEQEAKKAEQEAKKAEQEAKKAEQEAKKLVAKKDSELEELRKQLAKLNQK